MQYLDNYDAAHHDDFMDMLLGNDPGQLGDKHRQRIEEFRQAMSDTNSLETRKKLEQLSFSLTYYYQGKLSLLYSERLASGENPSGQVIQCVENMLEGLEDPEERKPTTVFIEHMVEQFCKQGYKKLKETAYRPKIIGDNINTRAYEPVCSIEEFIYNNVPPNSSLWTILTTQMQITRMCAMIMNKSPTVPELERVRGRYSFRNGIYDGQTNQFWKYEDIPVGLTGVSMIYHDFEWDVDATDVIRDLPTPAIDSLLRHQRWCDRTIDWFYVMVGRLMLPCNKNYEDWQIWPFLFGIGNTGKSTLINLISNFYLPTDVGVLSSHAPKNFELESCLEAQIVVIPEVDAECTIKATTIKSMVSAERLVINVKNQKPVTMTEGFDRPGIAAGNEFFGYPDIGGATSRRFMTFPFFQPVQNQNSYLALHCANELGKWMQKCVTRYHEKVEELKGGDGKITQGVWSPGVLPPLIHSTRKRVQAQTNPFVAFLEDDEYISIDISRVNDPSYRTSLEDLSDHFENEYRKSKNVRKSFRIQMDMQNAVYQQFGLSLLRDSRNNDRMSLGGLRLVHS